MVTRRQFGCCFAEQLGSLLVYPHVGEDARFAGNKPYVQQVQEG